MGATFNRIKTWVSEVLETSDLNAEFDNILTNLTPAGMDDASANAAAMQATEDPYPADSESLATNLTGEIKRLRYLIKQITGESEWYIDPDTDLASIIGGQMTLVTKTATYTATAADGIILVSASSGAKTITLPPIANVATGKAYAIKKIDTSTNAVTVDGDGTETIDGFVSRFLRNQNDYIWVYNDSANWVILGSSIPKRTPIHKNLIVRVNLTNPTYQVDIDADILDVEDAAYNLYRLQSANLTIDITASGANGLDTGAEAGNTTYAIWAIYNLTTNTVTGLLSTSFTLGGLTLPSGYTFGRLVGFVRNDGSSNFIPFIQHENRLLFDDPVDDTQALTAGSDLTFTDVDVTTWAGNTSIVKTAIIGWVLDYEAAGDATIYGYVRPNGATGSGKILAKMRKNTASAYYGMYASGEFMIHLDSTLIFEYKVTDAAQDMDMYVHGILLNI